MKVIFKFLLFCFALQLSFAANINNYQNKNSTQLEAKDAHHLHDITDKDYALETSVFGILIITIAKTIWSILSTVWSLAAYKLATLALITNSAVWIIKHGFTVVIGAVLMYGFCIVTDKCNLDQISYLPEGLIPVIPQELADAELALQKGTDTYKENEETAKDDAKEEDLMTS